jgi:hypothetical protein
MTDNKHISGLRLVNATRLQLTNHDADVNTITVNGRKLSHADVDLGTLLISGQSVKTKDAVDGQYYEVLNTNSKIEVKLEEEVQAGKVQSGQIIPAGDQLFKQQSPAPFAYIDTTGRLGSANLWNQLFVANVMGYVDIDKGANTYSHGLVPQGSSNHAGLFLRKDGQWGQPSLYTGSVSETFLSLQDTPATYTENIDKYLRVSYAEGGSVVFDAINTDKVPEQTNLYCTDERVNSQIQTKLQDKSISNISISGAILCNEVLAESDARLKRNVVDMNSESCLHAVSQLRPKSYEFIVNPNQQRFGVIAQELEQVLPTLVNTTNGTKSVNYVELIPFLIGSIQNLKQTVENLHHDVIMLQSQLKYSR